MVDSNETSVSSPGTLGHMISSVPGEWIWEVGCCCSSVFIFHCIILCGFGGGYSLVPPGVPVSPSTK